MIEKAVHDYLASKNLSKAASFIKKQKFEKGQIIYSNNEPNRGVFIVTSGLVKQFILGIDSRESIFKFCGKGDVFGHRSLYSIETHIDCATCVRDTDALFIPKDVCFEILNSNADIMKDFLTRLSEDSMQQIKHSQLLGQYSLKQRTAFGLIYLHSKNTEENSNEIHISRDDFANYIGAEKESVVRVMQQFKEDFTIQSSGKRIRIHKPDVLTKIAEGAKIKKAPLL